ncbi:ComF family protein [Gynurincola endophyticus]|uniref:ComF family protein n=1 Tax=Gynurincola endophyticus TaxID=2479004 RepID=UPI0013150B3F|nr:phosphoribosyltransferase family protein [Gynurincola endophyticus]
MRGYNQAAVISEAIARKLNIRHSPNLLKKISTSSTQTKKSRTDRAYSTAIPFCLNQYPEPDTHILIVDDIITTGNTLEAACNTFQGQNVKLSIATLGFTLKH